MPEPSNATPTTIEVKVEESREVTVQGVHEYTFYVNGQEYKELPLDANVREPDVKKSKPYKDMMETLSEAPGSFFENNLGISVIASDVVKLSEKKYALTFNNGTGILNGGHTQKAIVDSQGNANTSNAIIRLTVRVKDYTPSRIAEIAAAQNSSTAVKEYSLAEKRGLFVELKKSLDPNLEKHIIWWEGKEVAANKGMAPDDLIAVLNVFNFELYSSEYSSSTTQPKESANGKSGVFKRWERSEHMDSYKKIYPLINDILGLYEYIQLHFAEGTGMSGLKVINESKKELIFSNQQLSYDIPKQLLFPLLAAFRANVFYDANEKKVGWFDDNEVLFNKYRKELCLKLKTSLKACGNELNRISKDPAIWENLYTTLRDHIDKTKVMVRYEI